MQNENWRQRALPIYSRGEEIMNTVTHIAGGAIGLAGFIGCMIAAVSEGSPLRITATAIYGFTILLVYTMSSIYHALPVCDAKRVMQVLDHCSIYLLIAGTYTPLVLCALAPEYPLIGWGLFAVQWGLAAVAVTLTAIDLHKYRAFSKVCYIVAGWAVIFFIPQTLDVLGTAGFGFLLAGGIAYTIGAILFGLGQKVKWMHPIFHIFVILGTVLQMVTIGFFL